MAALTVGIIDPFHPKTVEAIAAVLPQDWRLSVTTGPAPEERAAALSDAEVLFVMATPVPAALLAAAPRLRFIQKLGAAVDRIDPDSSEERRVGKEGVRTCRHRWSPSQQQKKQTHTKQVYP